MAGVGKLAVVAIQPARDQQPGRQNSKETQQIIVRNARERDSGKRPSSAPNIRQGFKAALNKVRALRPSSAVLAPVAREAAARGWTSSLGALSAASVPLTVADEDGWTPVHHAAREGQAAAVAKLVQCGVALDERLPGTGHSPAHVAALHGQASVIKVLCEEDVRLVRLVDAEGFTPALLAAQHGRCSVLRVLGEHVHMEMDTAPNGDKAVHIAVIHGQALVLETLAAMGCRLDAKNGDGKTPTELADLLRPCSVARAAILRVLKVRGGYTHPVPELWARKSRAEYRDALSQRTPVLQRVHRSFGAAAAVTYRPGPVAPLPRGFGMPETPDEVSVTESRRPQSATTATVSTPLLSRTLSRPVSAPAGSLRTGLGDSDQRRKLQRPPLARQRH